MHSSLKRVHHFHADGAAFGGILERPIQRNLPAQASLSLPSVGGHEQTTACPFRYEGLFAFNNAHTQVSGTESNKEGGGWNTRVTSVVEGLNIAEVLTADRVVSQILIEHPAVGYEPRVSFLGSRIDNLAIGGSELEVILDFDLLNLGPGIDPAELVAAQKRGEKLPRFPKEPWTSNPWLLKKANEYMGLVKAHESMPDWLKHHFGWDTEKNEARWDNAETRHKETGHIACSLVKGVKGEFPGKAYGNVLEVPEFGKIFLGELAIYRGHFQLQMIRVELGCPVQGSTAVCMVRGNGRTQP